MYNLLICDDERDIVNALKIYLSGDDYNIFAAYNGREALELIKREVIHLVLMDIMMPVMDGIAAMAEIRRLSNVPVILLSAKSEDTDKILGLNVGADDYITKPFNPVEVGARVRSALRRYVQLGSLEKEPDLLVNGGIELNNAAKEVTVDGEQVSLTPKQYEILKLFMEHPGRVYSPDQIYREVWRESAGLCDSNTVAVHIRRLREKIEINPTEPRYIQVIFGQGYIMRKREELEP